MKKGKAGHPQLPKVEKGTSTMLDEESSSYATRLIRCGVCKHGNETAAKQLRTKTGFRASHCEKCGAQKLATGLKCSCGLVWHLCKVHSGPQAS